MDIEEFDDAHRRKDVAKIQNAMKIENIRKNLIEYCGYALQYVPNEFKSKELCETAVNISGCSLKSSCPHAILSGACPRTHKKKRQV